MYTKQYDNQGKHIGHKQGDTFYTLEYNLPENAVIDEGNKPTENEIAKYKALRDLSATDSIITRQIEDIYDVLNATQKGNLATETKQAIEDKKLKRQKYLDLL